MKSIICLIATNKYKQFVQPVVDSIKKHFLQTHGLEIALYTDDLSIAVEGNDRVTISKTLIPPYKFPEATLYRYSIITSRIYKCDYLFYMDVDMRVVGDVKEDILAPLITVLHPGFYNGGGSWGNNKDSNSYTPPQNRIRYYAGGFQGGEKDEFFLVATLLDHLIAEDENRGVRAEWNDETHWNKYLSQLDSSKFKTLSPAYCMVEQPHLRYEWGISHFQPKILALDKNHEEIRS